MAKSIGIIGAGLIGRILALESRLAGLSVTLIDRDNKTGTQSCAYTGAGMLSPYTELELAEPVIASLGLESLLLWPQLLKKLPEPVFFQQKGTLVLAHPQDQAELARFQRSIQYKLNSNEWQKFAAHLKTSDNIMLNCNRRDLITHEAELPSIFSEGIYLADEGQIDNRQLLNALGKAIDQTGINWQTNTEINSVQSLAGSFDVIIDCRGLGAKQNLQQLRGVRGEIIVVNAPEVKLNRSIRLMHPRHAIYVVPRENNCFIIGATSIESEDMRPLTVQSSLELLSTACTVHPAFAEGTVIESRVNCRPALPNNLPSILLSEEKSTNIIYINGLYRHGFLISPKIARLALSYIIDASIDKHYANLFQNFSSNISKEVNAFATSH